MCNRMHPRKPFLSIAEVAGYLGLSPATITSKRSRSRGELPGAFRVNRSVRYSSCDIARMMRLEDSNERKHEPRAGDADDPVAD